MFTSSRINRRGWAKEAVSWSPLLCEHESIWMRLYLDKPEFVNCSFFEKLFNAFKKSWFFKAIPNLFFIARYAKINVIKKY